MKKNKAMQLVKALRSGEYEQGRDWLVDNKDRFCCLGVACNISVTDLNWEYVNREWRIGNESTSLPTEVVEEFGFFSHHGARSDGACIEINVQKYTCLSDANDEGVSFSDIADYIENNWEYL